MALYIRPLRLSDMQQCIAVETAAFPPAEAATPEKIEYRLSVCPELCYGLFIRDGASAPERIQDSIPVINNVSNTDKLVAHTIATKSLSNVVKDEDMSYPPNWKADPHGKYDIGHRPEGTSIALHSLAVSPAHQRSGFGKALMNVYIDEMKKAGGADKITILTYDRLLPYYQNLGFTNYGKSECNYAGVAWHDLAYEFKS